MEKLAAFDIDGVLTKNSTYRHDWSYAQKDEYFLSDAALEQEVADGAKELLWKMLPNGWKIFLLTARPVWLYPRLAWMTYEWLHQKQLPYDKIIFGEDKLWALGRAGVSPSFVVEDNLSQTISLASGGLKVYLIGEDRIDEDVLFDYGDERIIIAKSLKDIWQLENHD